MEKEFFTVRGYQLLEQNKNSLTASLEDYLEMIYRCIQKNEYVRVNTLAKNLNVKPSSASKMIGKLAELGFIEYQKYGIIKLTPYGRDIGEYLMWRHKTIENFLMLATGNAEDRVFVETELIEHLLSKETVECLEILIKYLKDKNYRLS